MTSSEQQLNTGIAAVEAGSGTATTGRGESTIRSHVKHMFAKHGFPMRHCADGGRVSAATPGTGGRAGALARPGRSLAAGLRVAFAAEEGRHVAGRWHGEWVLRDAAGRVVAREFRCHGRASGSGKAVRE